MRWFGHMKGEMIEMELLGKQKRGGPKSRFMDMMKGEHANGWNDRKMLRTGRDVNMFHGNS